MCGPEMAVSICFDFQGAWPPKWLKEGKEPPKAVKQKHIAVRRSIYVYVKSAVDQEHRRKWSLFQPKCIDSEFILLNVDTHIFLISV